MPSLHTFAYRIALFMVLASGCASFQERATLATGVCAGGGVEILDADDHHWSANCDDGGGYDCEASGEADGANLVDCRWDPICGNDERTGGGSAVVER